ncbi:MAG: hypothetical protein WCD38_01320 [Candidatus Tumulicola sp.]
MSSESPMERIAREQDRIDTDAAPDRDRRNRELKEHADAAAPVVAEEIAAMLDRFMGKGSSDFQQLSEDFGSPRRRRFTLEKRSDVAGFWATIELEVLIQDTTPITYDLRAGVFCELSAERRSATRSLRVTRGEDDAPHLDETSLAEIIPKLRAQLVKAERESLDH